MAQAPLPNELVDYLLNCGDRQWGFDYIVRKAEICGDAMTGSHTAGGAGRGIRFTYPQLAVAMRQRLEERGVING